MKVILIPGVILCEKCLAHMHLGKIDCTGRVEATCFMVGCENERKPVMLRFAPVEAEASLRPIQELA